MKKQNLILSAALVAVFSASTAFAEAEVTGKIVHESAKFTTSGQGIGATTTRDQTSNTHGKDVMKTETSARIYIDGEVDEVSEGSTYHVELNLMHDSKGVGDYDSNESYTQRDALREAYVDTTVEDWSIRAGKQQVVWGTADGMKLLDNINPTDYSEMAQNQMEDSRMPVWMLNAETEAASGGSWQVILSEAKGHKIAGMGQASASATSHTNGDAGNAFIMKGVDSISGKVNGMMNVAPALGKVAAYFTGAAGAGTNNLYTMYQGATVGEFSTNGADGANFRGLCTYGGQAGTASSAYCLKEIADDDGSVVAARGLNNDVTNLSDVATAAETNYDVVNPNSAFEFMDSTTFATFYSFGGLTTQYNVEEASGLNTGLRYKGNTANGLNYSINFLRHEDSNPYVNMDWKDSSGNILRVDYHDSIGTTAIGAGMSAETGGTNTVVRLMDGATQEVAPILNLTEKHATINSVGGSFDTAIESINLGPVVLRGEFLYDQGVYTPVVDLARMSIGDIKGALTSEKGDYFKYVLGADITALTNMMVSAQIIQIRNLDYIDQTHTPSDSEGTASTVSGKRYTGDSAAMHMSNSFQKAEENKEFYSLFFSKPFGASGEHRWNNIFMFEENGGKWNRLDAEFSIDDDTQATVEYNKYWGDANTQFGQLEKSSNIQVGVKYSF